MSKRSPQGFIRCASTEYDQYQRDRDPKKETVEEFEKWIAPLIEKEKARRSGQNTNTVITIPVVIHIIHNGDALGNNENISTAQALSQITVLNQDFRKMLGTPGYNTSAVGADVEIEFCMAQRNPDGLATNGIDRVNYGASNFATMSATEAMKSATQWDPTQYFNIWTVFFSNSQSAEMNGTLGYAQFPFGSGLSGLSGLADNTADTDGLVVDYRCFGTSDIATGPYFAGYDKGRTSTHEIGHCFGLRHIWGDAGSQQTGINCSGTDYCADTPTAGWENYDCADVYDSCPATGNDMVENYMDYTNDTCMNIFTTNQKTRITTVMNNSPRRASLKTSLACTPALSTGQFEFFNGIRLYPNPAKDVLNIKSSDNTLPNAFIIYNSLGQMILNRPVSSEIDLTVNTSSYQTGVYYVKIMKDNGGKSFQFIKE